MGCLCTKLSAVETAADGNNKTADCVVGLISAYEELCIHMPQLRPFGNAMPNFNDFMLRHQKLFFLSRDYLRSAVATIKLLAELKLTVSIARGRQANIVQALKFCMLNNYSQALSKLKEFMEAEDPFSALTSTAGFASLCERAIKHLNYNRNEIRDKIKSMKRWKKVWKVMCNAAFVTLLLSTVVLAAMSVPPFATAAAAAGCTAIKTGEQWADSVCADRLKALEEEMDVVMMMYKAELGAHELESVKAMVRRVEIGMGSIESYAGFAMDHCEEEDAAVAMAMAMERIEGRMGEVEEGIEGVEMKVEACESEIRKVVAQFLDVITNYISLEN